MVKILSLFLLVSSVVLSAAAPSLQEDLPDYAFVAGIVAHGQTYPLSCESRSAADLANYWGIPVDEVEFFDSLPISDNPEKGFVGSVRGVWGHVPPNSYGVHAVPVASLLRQYGLDAKAQRGLSLYELKREIANGRPVIVWVVGHVWQGAPETYKAKDGSQVTVARFEHTMIAYGYDKAGVYLIDAGNGTRGNYGNERFKNSWGVLGNMAVTASGTIHNKLDEYDCGIYDEDAGGFFDILIPWSGDSWQKSPGVQYHCPL